MPKFYCFNCGHGTDYTFNKPRVCLKCDQVFGSLAKPTTVVDKTKTAPVKLAPTNIELVNNSPCRVVADEEYNDDFVDIDAVTELPPNQIFADITPGRNCTTLTYNQLVKEKKLESLLNNGSVTKTRRKRNKKP